MKLDSAVARKVYSIKESFIREVKMLEEFKDNKNLVRISPFLVATAMGKADGIFLEEEKVFELSHFEEFSLHSDDFSSAADIFLDLENDDFHHIWELEVDEIISALKELPVAARIVLGLDADSSCRNARGSCITSSKV